MALVLCIIAFPMLQWLKELASVLHYTYLASLVKNSHFAVIARFWTRKNIFSHYHCKKN
jgi:hypothetical protein